MQANEVGGAHSVHYRYLAEQELTESEKALIHHEVPTEFQDEDILYVVYRKKATNSQQLPYTGSKELALAGLGLATASLAVFFGVQKRSQRGSRCSLDWFFRSQYLCTLWDIRI